MRLTKLGHSCVRLEKDGATLVIDPGGWSEPTAALQDAAAVLVTHEHPDHLDPDAVRAALSADPDLTLHANQSVAVQFSGVNLPDGTVVDIMFTVTSQSGRVSTVMRRRASVTAPRSCSSWSTRFTVSRVAPAGMRL